MDFVLVVPLILALLTTGQSFTMVANNSCYNKCPAGFYKVDDCNDSSGIYLCQKCGDGTYTDIENFVQKCHRCDYCAHNEEPIKPCSFNSNVVCDCKKGYYNANHPDSRMRDCKQCTCGDQGRVTTPKSVCMNYCSRSKQNGSRGISMKDTQTTPPTPSATPTTTPTTTSTTTPTTTATTTRSPPNIVDQMPWLFLVGIVVTFLLLFWLLLFFTRNPLRFPERCPCLRLNKAQEGTVEDPRLNEQRSHQSSSPTTLTLTISEETPMMALNQSPATPDPACVSPVLPDAEHKAARQEEQSGHWPAIVLYAIIKEVPLRRWKEFLRLLSVADQQLERVELEAGLGLGSMERQYQMLRLWSQRASSTMNDVFSALHYMDLSGCAQLLQESLEKLPWRPELKQGCTDNGAMQDT